MLDVLRNCVKESGCKFRLAYFRPASGLNEELHTLYRANLFAVLRQLHYSEKDDGKCIDLALFLNGIPIFRALKQFLFDEYLRGHRLAEELIKRGESKTLEFKSTLRWSTKESRKDDRVTFASIRMVAAFMNTDGGDLLIGVADNGSVVGTELDQFESDDKFMLHLAQVVRNALGDRAGTLIDPGVQVVQGKTVCVVTCQRSPEPVFLKWKDLEEDVEGDFFVRSGPGTVRLDQGTRASSSARGGE